MKLAILTTAAFLASTTFLSAQSFSDKVIEKLEEQGFTVTEVENGGGIIKVEATRNGKDRELVYDAQSGELLKDEYDGEDQIDDDEEDDQGEDLGTDEEDDDDSDDDDSDDDDSDDDDSDDDDSGDDDDDGDDSDDDDSGDDDDGGDDSDDDDSGDDDS